jgi:broad specificity phosphatase PhoE
MSKWYFLRHAETAANVGRLYNPDSDELTQTGKEQCAAAKPYMETLLVDKVFCSPLSRAVDTARRVGIQDSVLVAELTDRNFGEFAGKPYGSFSDYCKQHGFNKEAFVPKHGESIEHMHKRVTSFLDELPDGDYLFITHAGIIMQAVHERTERDWSTLHVENAALWVFEDGKLIHENWKPWLLVR